MHMCVYERNMIYMSGQVRCKLQGVSYIVSKRYELWSTNGFKLEVSFHPPSVNSAVLSLPGFADGDQLDQTLPYGGR